MRMPGSVIALVAVFGVIGILEIVFTWWEAFASPFESLQYFDSVAQAPLAIVLLIGLAGVVLRRSWSVLALLVYAVGGVVLGFASMLDAIVPVIPLAREMDSGFLVAAFVAILMLAVDAGGALVLLILMLPKSRRERLVGWSAD